jgi:cell division septation protein DedD
MKAPPPDACASCGAPAEPGQEYCLDCGARIVPARRVSPVGRAWQRRLGRYPGDWIWASLLLALVAAGSATAGIVAGRDTGTPSASRTIVATSPVVTAPPAPPAVTTTTTKPVRPTPKPPKPTPRPRPATAVAVWPARNGYTVVLASIPARGSGLAEANAKAKEALDKGVRGAGVLTSGNFASLHPGYYVVFAGVYPTLDDAQTAARRISGKYPNAYARQVTR